MRAPGPSAERVIVADRLFVAALASGAAGCAHLSVAGEHLSAWWGYGAFFIGTGIAQLASGLAMVRAPRDWLLQAAASANAVLVLVYVASRTVGVPVGPEHSDHRLELSGPLDLATVGAEVLIVAALLPTLPHRTRRATVDGLLAWGLGLWLLRAAGRLG